MEMLKRHLGYILSGATEPFEDFRRLLFPTPPKRDARGNKIFGDLSPLIAGGEYHFLLDRLSISRAKHPNQIMTELLIDSLRRDKTRYPDGVSREAEGYYGRITKGLARLYETGLVTMVRSTGIRYADGSDLNFYSVTPYGEHIHHVVHDLRVRFR